MPKEPLKMVTREEWEALPSKSSTPMKLPVPMLLMLDTGTEECYFEEECLKAVQNLQKHYMEEKGMDDIPWSFLVGGDGRIYEGRGWLTNPIKTDLTNKIQADNDGRSYDIAYIGDYKNDYDENPMGKYPNVKACDAAQDLLLYLDKKKAIDMDTCDMIDFTIDYEALRIE